MWRNFRFWQVYGYNRDNFMEDREQRAISMFYLDILDEVGTFNWHLLYETTTKG